MTDTPVSLIAKLEAEMLSSPNTAEAVYNSALREAIAIVRDHIGESNEMVNSLSNQDKHQSGLDPYDPHCIHGNMPDEQCKECLKSLDASDARLQSRDWDWVRARAKSGLYAGSHKQALEDIYLKAESVTMASPEQQISDADERKAFEKWHYSRYEEELVWVPERNLYEEFAHHQAWKGWQARAEAALPSYSENSLQPPKPACSEIPVKKDNAIHLANTLREFSLEYSYIEFIGHKKDKYREWLDPAKTNRLYIGLTDLTPPEPVTVAPVNDEIVIRDGIAAARRHLESSVVMPAKDKLTKQEVAVLVNFDQCVLAGIEGAIRAMRGNES